MGKGQEQTALAMSAAQDERARPPATAPAATARLPAPDKAQHAEPEIKQHQQQEKQHIKHSAKQLAKHPKPRPKPYAKNAPGLQQRADAGMQGTQGGTCDTPSASFYTSRHEASPSNLFLPLSPDAKGGVGPAPPLPPTRLSSGDAKDPQVCPQLVGRHYTHRCVCLEIDPPTFSWKHW